MGLVYNTLIVVTFPLAEKKQPEKATRGNAMDDQPRAEDVGVIELGYVPDIFVSGITEIEELGDHIRVTHYSERKIDGSTRVERIVVAHIVMTNEGFQRALRVALGAMKHCAPECPRRSKLS